MCIEHSLAVLTTTSHDQYNCYVCLSLILGILDITQILDVCSRDSRKTNVAPVCIRFLDRARLQPNMSQKKLFFCNFFRLFTTPVCAFFKPVLYLQMYHIFVRNNHKKLFEIFLTQMANT